MKDRIVITAAVIASAVLVTFLWFFNPTQFAFFPRCGFHLLTGLYCPGCGMSRALHALLHGNLAAALGFNPLLFVVVPMLVYVSTRPRRLTWIRPSVVWTFVAVVIVFGVARNIPAYPFTMLTP